MGNDLGCRCNKASSDAANPSSDYQFQDPEIIKNSPMKQKQSQMSFQSKDSFYIENLSKILTIQSYYKKHTCQQTLLSYLQTKMKLFDSNIKSHASLITTSSSNEQSSSNESLSQYISDTIKQAEQHLPPFTPNQSELSKYHYTFEREGYLFKRDNSIYKGSWNYNGKKHGFGIYIDNNGNKYIGFWENDCFEHRGRLTDVNGSIYEGMWHKGKAHGNGVLYMKNGYKYEGTWVNDYQEGKGVEKYSDDSYYEGEFVKGHKHGQGKYVWSDGSEYVGTFVQGNIQGKGEFKWTDGRKYNGEWKDGQLDGKGEFTWKNGKKYVGEYKRSKKNGYGVYYWRDDIYYEGKWANNTMHGEGKFVNGNIVIEGVFRYGKFIRNKGSNKNSKRNNEIQMNQTMEEYQEENGESIIQEMHNSFERDSYN